MSEAQPLLSVDTFNVCSNFEEYSYNLRHLFGKANEYKEGDATINIAASSAEEREHARSVIKQLKLSQIHPGYFMYPMLKSRKAEPQSMAPVRPPTPEHRQDTNPQLPLGLSPPSSPIRDNLNVNVNNLKLDELSTFLESSIDQNIRSMLDEWTFDNLKQFLLNSTEKEIKEVMPGLRSVVIAGVCKLCSNEELIQISSKIYNSHPGCTLGKQGYFGSRIQPNSPTDDPEEVLFSVLEGLSYGCGDAVLGINIVASDLPNLYRLEFALRDVAVTLGIDKATKWCVLAHIDDQMKLHTNHRGLVDAAFQSIGGNEEVNKVFNVTTKKLRNYYDAWDENKKTEQPPKEDERNSFKKIKLDTASATDGPPSMYFETGQGSALTNGVAHGVDMVTLEANAHGLARAISKKNGKWMIVNSVVGFIGPEVFKSSEQLKRACLEDLFMGKLHGLTMGLDICSTYHMGVEVEELLTIKEEVLKAAPAFYMSVAGNSDPMLSYLTTSYRDHPRLRKMAGRKVSDEMKKFYIKWGVMDKNGDMTELAGNTAHMYLIYRRRKKDLRSDEEILQEANERLTCLQRRGLDLGYGHDGHFHAPERVAKRMKSIYSSSKRVLKEEFTQEWVETWKKWNIEWPNIKGIPKKKCLSNKEKGKGIVLNTLAGNRNAYISKPELGEQLTADSLETLNQYRLQRIRRFMENEEQPNRSKKQMAHQGYFQIVVSDGLNPESLTQDGQLQPFLEQLHFIFKTHPILKENRDSEGHVNKGGYHLLPDLIIVNNCRVRAGYRIGEFLFGGTGGSYDKMGQLQSETGGTTSTSRAQIQPLSPGRTQSTENTTIIYPSPNLLPADATTSQKDNFELNQLCGVIHLIGERPGNGQNTYSAYISIATRGVWNEREESDFSLSPSMSTEENFEEPAGFQEGLSRRKMNHDQCLVVSGISQFALDPTKAAGACVELIVTKLGGHPRGSGVAKQKPKNKEI